MPWKKPEEILPGIHGLDVLVFYDEWPYYGDRAKSHRQRGVALFQGKRLDDEPGRSFSIQGNLPGDMNRIVTHWEYFPNPPTD